VLRAPDAGEPTSVVRDATRIGQSVMGRASSKEEVWDVADARRARTEQKSVIERSGSLEV